jgi:hypothetical protein
MKEFALQLIAVTQFIGFIGRTGGFYLLTASCSKQVSEGDIIATAYVTQTVIAAD